MADTTSSDPSPSGVAGRAPAGGRARLAEFERRMAKPIVLSAVLPLILAMAGAGSIVAAVVSIAGWVVFVVDFVVHRRLVPGYARTRRGVFDLAVVMLTAPWFLIPGLGLSRFVLAARLARLVRVVQASGDTLMRLARQLGRVGVVVALVIASCAYVVFSAERKVNDEFAHLGDALWWATVTITTVGYGDIVPVTLVGRITAAVLMFSGLAVLGVLAGTLASFFGFGEEPAPQTPAAAAASATAPTEPDELQELRDRLDELERALVAARRRLG